jgi:CheY-like chemotaxis protein
MSQTSDRPVTVLIVEDVEEVRAAMERLLRRHGYRVVSATDALEAVEVASRVSPHLIFTEEALPTLSDLNALVRQHPNLHQVPLVIVNPDEEEATRYGDIIVLTDYDQLQTVINGAAGASPSS